MSYEGAEKSPMLVGPWGGNGGSPWNDGVHTSIRQVVVAHGAAIDSIQIEYDSKGIFIWSEKHGGNGGSKIDKILLNHPEEILVSISGCYGALSAGGPLLVRSLTFESNRKKYGPYGFQQGAEFSFPVNGGKVVGFHGRSGWFLDSVGVYLKPTKKPSPNALVPTSRSIAVNGTSKTLGYNVTHGSFGKGYDVVAAVREKEGGKRLGKVKSSSGESSDGEDSSDDSESKIKLQLQSYPSSTPSGGGVAKYGPWGGSGGTVFDDGTYSGVQQITLTRNAGITSIKVLYDKNGIALWGSKHGGAGGIKTDKIVLDYPYEVLTHITGYYGTTLLMGPTAVKSLTFHTTRRTYGPYGEEQGVFFSSSKGKGMVVGFHGRKGWYVDCIGVHVLEGKLALPQAPPPNPVNWTDATLSEISYGVVKEPVPSGPGPWGGEGGRPWDDGVFNGVKQIFLTRGSEGAITSIQIEYDRNGQSVWSTRHGSGTGESTHRIKFDYPNETLNCICGYYGSTDKGESHRVIRSLTFYTSRGKYGPFGEELGTFFTSTTTQGKVVGFHGRCGLYLNAIGVHMQHWLGEAKPYKSKIAKFFS